MPAVSLSLSLCACASTCVYTCASACVHDQPCVHPSVWILVSAPYTVLHLLVRMLIVLLSCCVCVWWGGLVCACPCGWRTIQFARPCHEYAMHTCHEYAMPCTHAAHMPCIHACRSSTHRRLSTTSLRSRRCSTRPGLNS